MFNLLITHSEDAWLTSPSEILLNRFLEYTDIPNKKSFLAMTEEEMQQLLTLPAIFAYEKGSDLDPKFGRVTKAKARGEFLHIFFEIIDLPKFLSQEEFQSLAPKFDLYDYELNRTHWAVKEVDLSNVLSDFGIALPGWAQPQRPVVDLRNHIFRIALSFPGEVRAVVKEIADDLNGRLGHHSCFYDWNYLAQLAGPSLDLKLQKIYSERSKLIIVFLSGDYQSKDWCGIEWRAIREIIKKQSGDRVMYIRMDDGDVSGVFENDGYIDGTKFSSLDLANFIYERALLADLIG